MRWLSSPSLTSWRDVPAAEAWPPSSELGQTAPRMIVPVVSPRGLLLVPSRSFTSGLLLACPFEILRVRLVACPFEILRVQRCGHDLARVFPLTLVAVVRSSGLLSRVRRVVWAVIGLSMSAGSVLVHWTVSPLPPSLSAQGPGCLAARRGSCAAYPLRWNSNVKLSLSAARLPGGAGRA